jgi:S-DNA-T family DNA segregation ATPase FtsK/SpoIIIE
MTGLRTPVAARVRTAVTVVDTVTDERVEVLLELQPDDRVSALEAALVELLHPRGSGLWLGAEGLEPSTRLRDVGLRAGSVLGVGGPLDLHRPTGGLEVQVVSGPGAGDVHVLAEGDTVLGRDALRGLSGPPVLLSCAPAGVVARELRPGARPVALGPGTLLTVGDSLLSVRPAAGRSGLSAFGAIEVTRPPRLRTQAAVSTVEVPAEPTAPEPRRLAVLPLLLPVVLGVVMAVLSSPLFLLFTLMSPLMALSTWWTDRKHGRRSGAKAAAAHLEAMAALDATVTALTRNETAARRDACPDPAAVLQLAVGPGPRLWERRRRDDDSLLLRVGTGALPSTTVRFSTSAVTSPPPAPELTDVPVSVSLRSVGVLGVAGEVEQARAVARWLVGQAAALHSPKDLSVWLLVDPSRPASEPDWGWLRWLPHTAPGADQDCFALVGTSIDGVTARVAELTALVSARTAAARDVRSQLATRAEPDLLVVLDGARALRALPGMPVVLRDGPAVGVHVVCLEDRPLLLPEECQAVVADGALQVAGSEPVAVRLDLVSAAWADELARGMAPLRDAVVDDGEVQIPSSARLLEVLQLDPPTAAGVRARWGRTTAAVVGVDADGPFVLDLRKDGPHVLVAGTTGAGKSELLQTLVASLAVANRPDAMTFVLVDYKGGAAFKDCARLPHTVGMVTDLDGHLVERALASLTAELKTRELVLQQAGAKDIEDFWSGGGSLPRLVIVIDEFASLVEELPDFVRGLVGIAQRGRSLGVHLVLATQRPSGVVSPEIRANTNLRVALRVTDSAESLDVLDAPDAAAISKSTPGRAYARTGHASLSAFQCARVGGRRPGAGVASPLDAFEVPWSAVGAAVPARRPEAEPDEDATDLHALVEAVLAAAEGMPLPRSPWLEPLSSLALASLSGTGLQVPFGLEDHPAAQQQRPAVLDLEHGSHLLVAGAARSGRSTFLRTLAASLALTVSPDDAHLYALDCGNGALLPLADLPHTGAVVSRTQVDRADRLLARLTAEVTRRQELFASQGWASLAEQRSSGDPLPYLVLLVDRWEGFTAAFDDVDAGRMTDAFLRLLREGPGAGLRVVLTGDRSALLGKVSSAIEDTVVLRLADRSDYALAGLSPRQLPEVIPDGRGFRGTGVELQVAQLEVTFPDLAAALRPPTRTPFRVEALPARVSRADAALLPAPDPVGVGVGGDDLALLGFDPALHGPGFTIAGPPRSGRSTALLGLARGLLAAGTTVCVLTPRPSPLRDLAGTVRLSGDPAELASALNGTAGPVAVLVDDAELLASSPVADLLTQVLRDGRDQGHSVVLAGTTDELASTFRGFSTEARKSRSGLLLGLTSHLDGELLGVRLPRSAVSAGPIGRGLLIRNGQVVPVQVPV